MIIQDPVALSKPTEKFDFSDPPVDPITLAQKLVNVMYEADGIGLAANQIGIGLSCIAIRGWPEDIVMFNPRVVHMSAEEETMVEGCLSWPGLQINVKRSKDIRVRFEAPNGQTFTKLYSGMTARTIQHEVEHLQGKFFFTNISRFKLEKAIKKAGKLGFDYEGKGLLRFAK